MKNKNLTKYDYIFLGALAAYSVALRLPFVFQAEVNWDESVYIVVADLLNRGQSLYVDVWDVKPPLLFYMTAFILKVHDSILAVRIAAILLTVIVGSLSYLTSIGLGLSRFAAGIAAFLIVLYCSLAPGEPALSSELLALPFLSLGLGLTVLGSKRFFLIGCMLGAATLVRSNLGIVALSGCALFVAEARWRDLLGYIAGGASVLCATLLILFIDGSMYGFLETFLIKSWSYSDRGGHFISRFMGHIEKGFFLHSAALWALSLVAIPFAAKKGRSWLIILGFVCSVYLSIVMSGNMFEHYTVQLLPGFVLLAAVLFDALPSRRWFIAVALLCSVSLAATHRPLIPAYQRLFANWKSPWSYDYLLAASIASRPGALLCIDRPILYYLANKDMPTPVASPSALVKKKFASTFDTNLADVLDMPFQMIVKQDRNRYLRRHPELLEKLQLLLDQNYEVVEEGHRIALYARKN